MITKNYIKMCEQAEEIQKAWKPELGDICLSRFDGKEVIIIEKGIGVEEYKVLFMDVGLKTQRNYWYSKVNLKWLPKQEQLQEMVWDKTSDVRFPDNTDALIYYLRKFRGQFYLDKFFDSFNELWLAFVMKERWNKSWTDDKWVKAK